MWIHNLLAASNGLGLLAAYQAVQLSNWTALTVVLSAMTASLLMHLTETKHALHPEPFIWGTSDGYLDLDRCVAVLAGVYFVYQWYQLSAPLNVTLVAAFGLGFMVVGEHVRASIYVWLHLGWHVAAYCCMYLLIH